MVKYDDFYDKHVDNRKSVKKHKKKFINENQDFIESRAKKVSFKNYIRAVEEEFLDNELEDELTNANSTRCW